MLLFSRMIVLLVLFKKRIKYFNVGQIRGYSLVPFNALQLAYSDIIMMPCR